MSIFVKLILGSSLLLFVIQTIAQPGRHCTASDVTTGANLERCIFDHNTVIHTLGNRTDLSDTNLSYIDAPLGLELINIVAYSAAQQDVAHEINLEHAHINNLRIVAGGRRRNGEVGRPTGGINFLNMEGLIAPGAWIDAHTNQDFDAFINILYIGAADIHGGTIIGDVRNLTAIGANLTDVTLNIPLNRINNQEVLEELFNRHTQNNRLHLPSGIDLREMETNGPIDPILGWHFAVDAPNLILPTFPDELNFAGLNAPGINFQFVALRALIGVNFYGANLTNATNFNNIHTIERVNFGFADLTGMDFRHIQHWVGWVNMQGARIDRAMLPAVIPPNLILFEANGINIAFRPHTQILNGHINRATLRGAFEVMEIDDTDADYTNLGNSPGNNIQQITTSTIIATRSSFKNARLCTTKVKFTRVPNDDIDINNSRCRAEDIVKEFNT